MNDRDPRGAHRTTREPAGAVVSRLWGIVLAASDGPTDGTRRCSWPLPGGRRRPPQYHRVGSQHTLLRQTIDRASHLIPGERLVVVLGRSHARFYDAEFLSAPVVQPLVQPSYRGSAAEIYFPLLKIAARDPDAIAVVMPSDHLVDHDRRFMDHVAQAARAVAARPAAVVVIGAPPHMPDPLRTWIAPGALVPGLEPFRVRTVERLVHHPEPSVAEAFYEAGGLLSTFVMVAHAQTLIRLGREYLPDVLDALEPVARTFDGPEESLLSEAVYEGMPYASVSHELLARCANFAVLPMGDVMWSDWARPALHALAS
jgi:mannose-1-phosphate guanylyltransferase